MSLERLPWRAHFYNANGRRDIGIPRRKWAQHFLWSRNGSWLNSWICRRRIRRCIIEWNRTLINDIHLEFALVDFHIVGHGGLAVWGMNRLRSLERWDRGSESHSRHGCLCAFILFVVLCVGSGLATGRSPVQGVLPTVYKIEKLKKRPRSNKEL
jgi:hypothetical protein